MNNNAHSWSLLQDIKSRTLNQDWYASFQLHCQKFAAKWLIKFGKLTHVDYTLDELNGLLAPLFPHSLDIKVPVGIGKLTLLEGNIDIDHHNDHVSIEMLASLDIDSTKSPLYRAHLQIILTALPAYDATQKHVYLDALQLENIALIHDEYLLLNNSKQLLDLFVPKTMQTLVTGTLKSAMGMVTAGTSNLVSDYMTLYMSGSKQKVLDYHKPQITELLEQLKSDPELVYELDENDWQELLFRRYGKRVDIEQQCLRFKF